MSWIKDNQFIATLGGITLVGAAGLIVAGLQFSGKYADTLQTYEEASAQVGAAEGLPLYPTTANEQGKRKALGEYRGQVEELQGAFGKFLPEKLENIPPQEFTNRLQAARNEVAAAFDASKAALPGLFFLGFEGYTGTLARQDATGILDYQLGAAKELFVTLGNSKVSQLVNVHRPRLPEEDGTAWKAGPDDVSRPLSFEVVFKGTEPAVRDFFSAIAKSDKYYYVVRSVRISNEKKGPPLSSDAQFESAAAPVVEEPAPAATEFALPGDDAQPAEAPAESDDASEPDAAPEPAAAPVDTGRVLGQVLGNEEVYVFVRLDVLQFLPAKELPQP